MKNYTLLHESTFQRPLDEVFAFFSNAENLQAITPPWLNFKIVTPTPIVMRVGTTMDYRIRVHGVPFKWTSEITAWEPPVRFVDEQLRGPYRRWHHTHEFEALGANETLMRDRVLYTPRGGALMNWLFVRRDLEGIFRYRSERMAEIFATPPRATV